MVTNFILVSLFVLTYSQAFVKVQQGPITDCDYGTSKLTMSEIICNPPEPTLGEGAILAIIGQNPSNFTVDLSDFNLLLTDAYGNSRTWTALSNTNDGNIGANQHFEYNTALFTFPSSGLTPGECTYELTGYSAGGIEVGCWSGIFTLYGNENNGVFLGATGLFAALLLS